MFDFLKKKEAEEIIKEIEDRVNSLNLEPINKKMAEDKKRMKENAETVEYLRPNKNNKAKNQNQ